MAFTITLAIASNRPAIEAIDPAISTTNLHFTALSSSSITLEIDGQPQGTGSTINRTVTTTHAGNVTTARSNVRVIGTEVNGFDLLMEGPVSMQGSAGQTLGPINADKDSPAVFQTEDCNAWGFGSPTANQFNNDNLTYNEVDSVPVRNHTQRYASVPTQSGGTLIHTNREGGTATNSPTINIDLTIPFYFGACVRSVNDDNTTLREDQVYTATITWTAVGFLAPVSPITPMQTFAEICNASTPHGETREVMDARSENIYRVRCMPDNKWWMIDNLAYTGGGSNEFGDAVTAGANNSTTTNTLNRVTTNTGLGNASRRFVVNTDLPTQPASNPCHPTNPSGSGTMASICGNQVLYNWCAAVGLDANTTPTCAAASNTTSGTGHTVTGVIGRPSTQGGIGGESLGDGGTTICPAGWRLPVGMVGGGNPTAPATNEWNILNVAIGGANITSTTNDTGVNAQGFWQPQGNTNTNPSFNAMFGAVSAGNLDSTGNLSNQSTNARWWTSSLHSAAGAHNSRVLSALVVPGTGSSNKADGFSVRCVR